MAWKAGRSVPLVSASLWVNFKSVSWDCSNNSATWYLDEEGDLVERTRAGVLTFFFRREGDFLTVEEAALVRFLAALSWRCCGIILQGNESGMIFDGALIYSSCASGTKNRVPAGLVRFRPSCLAWYKA